jgi:hypothetical protein
MPHKPDFREDKIQTTYKKFLALFLKELHDKAPTHSSVRAREETSNSDSKVKQEAVIIRVRLYF